MTTVHTRPVAVIGAGRMGAAMVGRLRGAGHTVFVYNRTASRAIDVAASTGAVPAATAREAATGADFVVVSLADDIAVEAAYAGDDGLAAGLRESTVVLETSTINPSTVRALEPLVAKRGAVLLDTPVSGSVSFVERGELTFMVGGDPDALARARPVLDVLGKTVHHMGALGNGSVMKLAVNSVLLGLNQALAEALVLAERAGLDRAKAYEVFATSAIAAPFVHYKRDAFLRPDEAPAAFMLDLVAKDLSLVDALAKGVDARMDQLAAERRVVADALAAGYGPRDLSALAEYLRSAS